MESEEEEERGEQVRRVRRVVVGVHRVMKNLIPSLGLRRVCAMNTHFVDDLFVEGFCLTVPPGSVGGRKAVAGALEVGKDAEELVVDAGISV